MTYLRRLLICLLFIQSGSGVGGLLLAQSHDLYVCASLDADYVVGSNQSTQNGLFRLRSDGSWEHLGNNDPYVRAVSFDPRDSDVIYLATLAGAMRSLDGGAAWREMTNWRMTQPQDVEVDPHQPDHVFMALRDGVARSTDRGATWQRRENGLPDRGKYTQVLTVDRVHSGRVLAGCEVGVFMTQDAGASWSQVLGTLETVDDIQQSPHDPNVWITVTQSAGAWRSVDGGANWSQLPGVPTDAALYNVSFDPTDARRVAISSWTHGIYTTEDGGQTWQSRNAGLPAGHHVWRVGVHPDSGRLYASVTQSDLHWSDDFGSTWQAAGFTGSQISDFSFVPRP